MVGSRRAATTGTPFTTTLPQGTWAPWTATIGTTTTPGSGRTRAAWSASNDTVRRVGRGGSGRARAARTDPAGGGRDSAWSRSRTPHRARSPNDQCWLLSQRRPDRAGPPTRTAPAEPRGERCVAPPPLPAARRRRPDWAGTAAPSRPPQPPARQEPAPAGAPAGCQELLSRHPCRG